MSRTRQSEPIPAVLEERARAASVRVSAADAEPVAGILAAVDDAATKLTELDLAEWPPAATFDPRWT